MSNLQLFTKPSTIKLFYSADGFEATFQISNWDKIDEYITGWTKTFWGPDYIDLDLPGNEIKRRVYFLQQTFAQVILRARSFENDCGDLSYTEGWMFKLDGSEGIKLVSTENAPTINHDEIHLYMDNHMEESLNELIYGQEGGTNV